ncbi:MAG: hypothetical protein WCO95_00425, partial [Actinomycetes bacterium]
RVDRRRTSFTKSANVLIKFRTLALFFMHIFNLFTAWQLPHTSTFHSKYLLLSPIGGGRRDGDQEDQEDQEVG